MSKNITLEQVKASFGHSGCDCWTCEFVDTKFDNIHEVVQATERGLNELGVTSARGENYLVPAVKLFLKRNYGKRTASNGVALNS